MHKKAAEAAFEGIRWRRCMGIEPTLPGSLAPRGRCVSREATVPGAGPPPGFPEARRQAVGAGARKTTDAPPPFDSMQKKAAEAAFEGVRWRRCMGIEPTLPGSLAPRGRCVSREATVPGAGPPPGFPAARRQAVGAGARKTTDAPPPFDSMHKKAAEAAFEGVRWRRCMGIEPTLPGSLAPGGRCVSREATVPGAGPHPGFPEARRQAVGAGARKTTDAPPPFDSMHKKAAEAAFEGVRWRRCMGIEPTRRGVSPGTTGLKPARGTSPEAPPRQE